jgi:hypothetical protein
VLKHVQRSRLCVSSVKSSAKLANAFDRLFPSANRCFILVAPCSIFTVYRRLAKCADAEKEKMEALGALEIAYSKRKKIGSFGQSFAFTHFILH